MTGNEYQALAMRTNDKHSGDRLLNELTHKSICGNFESIGGASERCAWIDRRSWGSI